MLGPGEARAGKSRRAVEGFEGDLAVCAEGAAGQGVAEFVDENGNQAGEDEEGQAQDGILGIGRGAAADNGERDLEPYIMPVIKLLTAAAEADFPAA